MSGKTLTYIGVAIIAILLFTTGFAFNRNSKTKKSLNDEKLRSEQLLSEKLLVEKELDRLKADFSSLKEQSDANSKLLAETETKLGDTERRIRSLSRDYTARNKKEVDALQQQKADLEKEYSAIKADYEKLQAVNSDLESAKAALDSQKGVLEQKLKQMETFDTDNFMVYGSRGKTDKLTLLACRTKKLNVNFDVPQSLSESVSFTITTPSGTTVTSDEKALTWTLLQGTGNFTASLTGTGEFEQSRQVSLTYASKEKLQKGEYKIQILCNGSNIGNCRVRLK